MRLVGSGGVGKLVPIEIAEAAKDRRDIERSVELGPVPAALEPFAQLAVPNLPAAHQEVEAPRLRHLLPRPAKRCCEGHCAGGGRKGHSSCQQNIHERKTDRLTGLVNSG